jgi:hypothetical protein
LNFLTKIFISSLTGIIVLLYSCNNNSVNTPVESSTLLYDSHGLVDSAVVYGCYSLTRRSFIPDTLNLNNYSKLKFEFDGNTNSDGTIIFILLNTSVENNIQIYRVENLSGINTPHSFEADKPDNMTWVEVRLYINPPVCGQNEFKYNRVRDLKIYGIE